MDRRTEIILKIQSRLKIADMGFEIDGLPSPCHLWTGPTSGAGRGHGYGRMCLNNRTVAVHIVVATHYFGYIPPTRQVDHLCKQRACCNPAHLEVVSHQENQKRRAKKE